MANDKKITVDQLEEMARRSDEKFIDEEELKAAQESGEFDGVSIVSVKQTTTSSEDGGTNVITVTLSNGQTSTFTVKNGSKGGTGATGATGETGAKGADGANATINGVNALTLTAGSGISASQSGSTLTLSADPNPTSFTLAAANWVSGSGITAFPYKYTLSVSGVTADSVVRAVLNPASVEIAAECGMCSCCESGSGTVTFYSRTAPTSALTGTIYFT